MAVEISLNEARAVSDLRGLGKWKPRRSHANTHFCARNPVAPVRGLINFSTAPGCRVRRVTNDGELTGEPVPTYLRTIRCRCWREEERKKKKKKETKAATAREKSRGEKSASHPLTACLPKVWQIPEDRSIDPHLLSRYVPVFPRSFDAHSHSNAKLTNKVVSVINDTGKKHAHSPTSLPPPLPRVNYSG